MLQYLTDRRHNCINLIRIIAAFQVAYGHMVIHMHINVSPVINRVFGYFQGVPLFFLLSGFLIWDSID